MLQTNNSTAMNRQNLQRMADYIRTIPQEKFSMEDWREDYKPLGEVSVKASNYTKDCESVGCVIGHCTVLDQRPLSEFPKSPATGYINFRRWSEDFIDMCSFTSEWIWMFDNDWVRVDNTPAGAALRIEWLLNNGLPADLYDQLSGAKPLCYYNNDTEEKIL